MGISSSVNKDSGPINPIARIAVDKAKYERDGIQDPCLFVYDACTGKETLRVTRKSVDKIFVVLSRQTNGNDIVMTWKDDHYMDDMCRKIGRYIRACMPSDGGGVVCTNISTQDFFLDGADRIEYYSKNRGNIDDVLCFMSKMVKTQV